MKVDELRALIRELIQTELKEVSMQGTGTSITTGNSGAYSTPFAFRKKRKRKN